MFPLRRFPCLYRYFRTKQCWYKGPAGTPYFYPKCRSSEAAHTSSIPRRSLQRDVQNIGTAMNPHWSQGFPRRPRRWRDRPDRTLGTEKDGSERRECAAVPDAWRLRILPPDALVIQSGGPSRRAHDTGQNAVKVRESARRGQYWKDRGWVPTEVQRGRQNAGSRAPSTRQGAIRSHSSADERTLPMRALLHSHA